MFNIVLVAIAAILVIVGATKGQRRANFSKYIDGVIDDRVTAATLAPNTLVGLNVTKVTIDTCRISSIRATWSLLNFTPVNNSMVVVGVAHSDYTDAEVEGWLESAGSWDRGNTTAREVRSRMCRIVGTFRIGATGSAADVAVLNDGRPIKTKLNWLLTEGQTIKLWVFNGGAAAYATTVPVLEVQGKANLWIV